LGELSLPRYSAIVTLAPLAFVLSFLAHCNLIMDKEIYESDGSSLMVHVMTAL
jgi:hypothetical protein